MRRHRPWRHVIPLVLLLAVLGTAAAQFGRPPARPVEPIGRPAPVFRPGLPHEPIVRPGLPHETIFPPIRNEPRLPFSSGRLPGGLSPEYIMSPRPGLREPAHIEAYHIASLDPVRALTELSALPPGARAPEFARQQIVQESLNQLARPSHVGPDPWARVLEMQAIQGRSQSFSAFERAQLDAVGARLERTVLQRGVTEVVALGTKGNWEPTRAAAREWLAADARLLPERGPRLPPEHGGVRKSLQVIETSVRQIEGLARLEAALRLERGPNARFQEVFDGLEKQGLSPELRQAADGLRGLGELRTLTEGAWKDPPNVARLKQSVDAFERGLVGLTGDAGSGTLPGRLRQDLAMKAFLDGHPQAARELWPANGPPEYAANLLRDMKALLTGEGQLTTGAGQGALPPSSGQGGGKPPGPPPGLKFLMPEGPGDGWRPPVGGNATDGLPPLKEAARLAEPLGEAIARHLPRERDALAWHVQFHVNELQLVQQRLQKQDQDEKEKIERLEKGLAVPLQPAERVWVGQELRAGKSQQNVGDELKKKRRDEEIERGLALLKTYLAPKLTSESVGELLKAFSKRKVKFEDGELVYLTFTGTTVVPLQQPNFKLAAVPQDQWTSWAAWLLQDHEPGRFENPPKVRESGQEKAAKMLVGAARQLLQQGDDVPDVVVLFTPVLSKERVEAPGGIREAVQLDMIALDLGSALDGFEYARAQALIATKAKPAEVAAVLRQQRKRERRKADLERVKSYLDRPPTEDELKKARQLLEEDKEVADVVASLPDALSPERRKLDGGVRAAVLIDEVRQGLNPAPDAAEYGRARKMLREGKKSSEVVVDLYSRRAKAFEELVQSRLEQVNSRVKNAVPGFVNELKKWEREQAEDMLRGGMSVEEVTARIQRVRRHIAGND